MIRLFILLSLLFTMSQADFIGGEVDLGIYTHSMDITSISKKKMVDVKEDLTSESKGDIFLKVYLEHPIPFIQNLRLGYSSFRHKSEGVAYKKYKDKFKFFDVDTDMTLDIFELGLYYEIFDSWIDVDAGVNFKYVKGSMLVDYVVNKKRNSLDFPVPMLYTKIKLDIPVTDLSLQFEGDFIEYNDKSMYDLEVGLRYNFMLGFGIEAGYKAFRMKFDDVDNLGMNSDYHGVYGKVVWDF